MKRLLILSGLVLGASQLATAQVATFTAGAVTNTTTTGTPVFGTSGTTVSLSGSGAINFAGTSNRTFTVNNAVSGINNRFDVSVVSTVNLSGNGTISQTGSTTISGAGSASHNSTSAGIVGPTVWTDRFALQTGNSLGLSASISGTKGSVSSQLSISGVTAPLATGSITAGAVASPGSPILPLNSTSTLWVFDFPGSPPTGTATLNLSNVTAAFSRALDSAGGLSLHRDNVRIEVATFLDGIQVGTTSVSAVNTSLAPLAGTGSNSIAYNSIPSVVLNPADLYNQTRALTVVTKLIGTAYFGNSTSLADYTIAQSTFSGVSLQGVPEPATIAGLSLGLLAFARRRKSK